jgi:hypothetical protein
MRRYCQRAKISGDTPLTIELLDLEGKLAGPSRIRFIVEGHELSQTQGVIAPLDLVAAFGSIDADIAAVSKDAQSVALGAGGGGSRADRAGTDHGRARRSEELCAESRDGRGRTVGVRHQIRGRVQGPSWSIAPRTDDCGEPPDRTCAGQDGRDGRRRAEVAHRKSGRQSLGMYNEEVGTWLAGKGESLWDKGGVHYVVGGVAYAGAFLVAFVDAAEQVASMGYHDTATAEAQAYEPARQRVLPRDPARHHSLVEWREW